jgi:hypothetical protein
MLIEGARAECQMAPGAASLPMPPLIQGGATAQA